MDQIIDGIRRLFKPNQSEVTILNPDIVSWIDRQMADTSRALQEATARVETSNTSTPPDLVNELKVIAEFAKGRIESAMAENANGNRGGAEIFLKDAGGVTSMLSTTARVVEGMPLDQINWGNRYLMPLDDKPDPDQTGVFHNVNAMVACAAAVEELDSGAKAKH